MFSVSFVVNLHPLSIIISQIGPQCSSAFGDDAGDVAERVDEFAAPGENGAGFRAGEPSEVVDIRLTDPDGDDFDPRAAQVSACATASSGASGKPSVNRTT